MKRMMLVWVMALIMALQLAIVNDASADETYTFDHFTIVEANGKYGILDPAGEMILPVEYYIPVDQFGTEEQPVCIEVYQPVDDDFDIIDLGWELDRGTVKGGFFHAGSRFFSECTWKQVIVTDQYVAVCDENDRYMLLDAETGEVILEEDQYAWIYPQVSENWIYVWLWPDEIEESIGPDWDIAYINLDGTILMEPEGYHFSEESKPIVDGTVLVYDENGYEMKMRVEDVLQMNEEKQQISSGENT